MVFKPPRFKGDTHRSIILVSRGVTNETHSHTHTRMPFSRFHEDTALRVSALATERDRLKGLASSAVAQLASVDELLKKVQHGQAVLAEQVRRRRRRRGVRESST
jgi:hypothetical protein